MNFKSSAHLHNLYHDFPELRADQACFHGKASFEKITSDIVITFSAIVLYTLIGCNKYFGFPLQILDTFLLHA